LLAGFFRASESATCKECQKYFCNPSFYELDDVCEMTPRVSKAVEQSSITLEMGAVKFQNDEREFR